MVKFNFGLEDSTEINEQQKAAEQQADQAAAQVTASEPNNIVTQNNNQSAVPEGLAIENEETLTTTTDAKQEINKEVKVEENNIPQNTAPIINPQPVSNNSISFGIPEKNTNILPQNNQGQNVNISGSLIDAIKGIKEKFRNMVKDKEEGVNLLEEEKERLVIKFEEDKKNIEKLITKENIELAREKREFYDALGELSHLSGDERTEMDLYTKKNNNPSRNRKRT
jgi:hypothetical protein